MNPAALPASQDPVGLLSAPDAGTTGASCKPGEYGAVGMLRTLRATGAGLPEALALVAQAHGEEVAMGLVLAICHRPRGTWRTLGSILRLLKEVAQETEVLAQMCLEAWLERLGLRVDEELNLKGHAWVTALPAGLTVGGGLYLQGTRIAALPGNLCVVGALDAKDCLLTALPDDLLVGGDLRLGGTRIGDIQALRVVNGDLSLSLTPVETLPDGLRVLGRLDLEGSRIRNLPPGLWVGNHLWLRECQGWDGVIPADAAVGGTLCTDACPTFDGIALDAWRRRFPAGEHPDPPRAS
jgi:hypothetical protein